jgi:hypothetical protein
LYENEAGEDALVLIVFVGKETVLQPALASAGAGHVCYKGGAAEKSVITYFTTGHSGSERVKSEATSSLWLVPVPLVIVLPIYSVDDTPVAKATV